MYIFACIIPAIGKINKILHPLRGGLGIKLAGYLAEALYRNNRVGIAAFQLYLAVIVVYIGNIALEAVGGVYCLDSAELGGIVTALGAACKQTDSGQKRDGCFIELSHLYFFLPFAVFFCIVPPFYNIVNDLVCENTMNIFLRQNFIGAVKN